MTMPDGRTRAMLWAGSFLIELAQDKRLPLTVRRQAVVIARHYPAIEEVNRMALFRHPTGLSIGLAAPDGIEWRDQCAAGPLTYSTRLAWP